MADWYGGLNGGQLHLQAYETGTSIAGNYSTVQVNLWIERTSGSGKWSNYTDNNWQDYLNGGTFQAGSGTYDLRGGGSQLLLSGVATIYHNPDGTGSVGVTAGFNDPHGNLGSTSAGGTLGLSTIPRQAGAPTATSVAQASSTSATLSWTAASAPAGAPVTSYLLQASADPTFASGVVQTSVGGSALSGTVTGLTPGTTQKLRVAAVNAAGQGPWSNVETVVLLQGLRYKSPADGTMHDLSAALKVNGAWVPLDVKVKRAGAMVALH